MSESQSAAGGSTARRPTGTLQLVREAAQQGAADAQEAAAKTLAATGQCVYAASYVVSYGLVFPVALIALALPRNNAAVRGLIDGALAAKLRVHQMRATPAGPGPALGAG
jgi:hypothetical protein